MNRHGTRVRLGQAAAAAGSSVRAASAAAGSTVRSRATHAAEGLVAAAKDAANRSVGLARSGAATATGGLTVTRTAAVDALQGAADMGATIIRSGTARVAAGLAATSATVVPRLRFGSEAANAAVRSGGASVAGGFITAHGALTGFAENLDWSTIDPTKYLYAGTRGISRGLEEARLVWESIPERLRVPSPQEVGRRLEDFDWSHIRPHSQGGGNEASNGIFELASLNRSRGAEQMTATEIQAAQQVLSEQAFRAALVETASQVFRGAVIAAAVSCVLSALEHGLEYQRGEIVYDEMYRRIGRAVAMSGAVGGAVAGVMTGVALAFPALIPLAAPLMMPLAVLGFCTVGVKIVRLGKGWYELYQGVPSASWRFGIPAPSLDDRLVAPEAMIRPDQTVGTAPLGHFVALDRTLTDSHGSPGASSGGPIVGLRLHYGLSRGSADSRLIGKVGEVEDRNGVREVVKHVALARALRNGVFQHAGEDDLGLVQRVVQQPPLALVAVNAA